MVAAKQCVVDVNPRDAAAKGALRWLGGWRDDGDGARWSETGTCDVALPATTSGLIQPKPSHFYFLLSRTPRQTRPGVGLGERTQITVDLRDFSTRPLVSNTVERDSLV